MGFSLARSAQPPPPDVSFGNIFALELTFYKWACSRSIFALGCLKFIAIKYLNAHFLNAHRGVKCENYAFLLAGARTLLH